MRKVFTYSRKKPFSNVKNVLPDESSKENLQDFTKSEKRQLSKDSNSKLVSSLISNTVDSSGDTPQTKRHKDIKNLLTKIDCKLKFLELNENADFHKFYRHKNIILAEIRDNSDQASLSDLLKLIGQDESFNFHDWFSKKLLDICDSSKLGEATFSEVFKLHRNNGLKEVIKIIPLELEHNLATDVDIYPLPININAAIHECTVLKQVSKLSEFRKHSNWSGFNEILEISVVQGRYPEKLIENWQNWNNDNNSENSNPNRYDDGQYFLLISMMDGGIDLEKFKIQNMKQVQSIIIQLVNALDLAEQELQFEHRDLHLGNVLIKEIDLDRHESNDHEFSFEGIQCSIIDYSLSRMSDSGTTSFRDLDTIDWLFEGDPKIDSQYQVYKDMRTAKGNLSWEQFNPRSNIIWLAFILDRLVLKQKKSAKSPKNIFNSLLELQKRIYNYTSARELKSNDEFFKK